MSPSLTVRDVRTHPVVAPLKTPITTAVGPLSEASLLLIDITTQEGVTGHAYLFSYQRFVLKPLDELVKGLGKLIAGEKAAPGSIEPKLRRPFTLFGGTRGLAGIAISGLDMALWDALAKAASLPLAALLGGLPRPIRAYNSLGMLSAKNAEAEAEKALTGGFKAIKFKIGWPTLEEDLAAVRAARKGVPSDVALMVDFNQSLNVPEAIRRCRALDDEGLAWIEEPVRCNDFRGCAQVAAETRTPIQIGENFAGPFDMEAALHAGACDFVMPDPQQIGGVSGWLRAAALAQAAGKPCSSHIFIEASAHLLAVTPTCDYLEYLDSAGAVLQEPARVVGGAITASTRPGTGVAWEESAVKRYRVE